ncbi:hypothetical protein [Streptomyces yangpuensis]|uniref:hypothetical protein n=1 Tax=Streptomyces yangpuensis TaxID=1648182 RepID=UPI00365D82F0
MKLSPQTAPVEPDNLLIRFHNQVGAALDITGTRTSSRWYCHGCGYRSTLLEGVLITRQAANSHAATCRAAYHRLGA